VARVLDEDELIEHWTLVGDELGLRTGRTGPSKLGLALWLKFFIAEGRFPSGRSELPDEAVAWVARQVKVPASDMGLFDWEGRTAERLRSVVRTFLGFRECSVADAEKLTAWLADDVCSRERQAQRVREALLARMRQEQIEQPTRIRVGRMIGSALRQSEEALTAKVSSRLDDEVTARMWAMIAAAGDDPGDQAAESAGDPGAAGEATGPEVWAAIRSDPGNVSLNTCKTERRKLDWIRAVGLPAGLLSDMAPKIVAGWRARVAVEAPSHLRNDHPDDGRWTLMAAYLHCREREITDSLVELLIATVHRINARAETRTRDQFVSEIARKVTGKENILFKIAAAASERPDGIVEEVVYPAAGGLEVLLDLVREFESKGPTYRQARQRSFKASYTNHYRAGLVQILEALELRSNNTVHRPVLEALELIKRYKAEHSPATLYYARGEHVPVDGVIPRDLVDLLYKTDKRGRSRVQRTVYECGVFQTLRDKLRCKEIWVVGADKWRNPDEDLPADFEDRRAENYAKLRKPLDPKAFTSQLRAEMEKALADLNDHLPELDWVDIRERAKAGPIVLTDLDAVPEPRNLRRLKAAIRDRWGTVPLLDMLTETALRTGCLDAFAPVGNRSELAAAALFQRLLLTVYAYGTNTGIRAVAAADHGHGEDELRYVRRRYMTVESCRQAARVIANATFAARQAWLWGEGSTAVASDSTHFRAWDQNIFTEWHSRYRNGKRGVLIYWTVEKGGDGRAQPAPGVLGLRGPRDGRGRDAARHRHGGPVQLRRHAWPELHRVRDHAAPGIRPAAADQADQPVQALPPVRRRPGPLPAAAARADQPHPLGANRTKLRPHGEVRHGDPVGHRVHRGDPAALQLRCHPPRLRRDARGRPRPAHHLHSPLPARPGPAARDQRRTERRGELQRGQRLHLLRQVRGAVLQPARGTGDLHDLPADPPKLPWLRQYPDDPGYARRAGMGRPPRRRRPARPDPAVHRQHDALRRDPAQPRPAPGPGRGRRNRAGTRRLTARAPLPGRAAEQPDMACR
jgi:hypothetical protein